MRSLYVFAMCLLFCGCDSQSAATGSAAPDVRASTDTGRAGETTGTVVEFDLASGPQNDFQFRLSPLRDGDQLRASLLSPGGDEILALVQHRNRGTNGLTFETREAGSFEVQARLGGEVVASLVQSFAAATATPIGSTLDDVTSVHERCRFIDGDMYCYVYYDLTGTPTGASEVSLTGRAPSVRADEVGVVVQRSADKQPVAPSRLRLSMSDGMEMALGR